MALPELIDDAVAEILLRLPPDEPVALFRASLVCKCWLRITTNPAFLRLYRAFHHSVPLLGFFYNFEIDSHARFISTTAAAAAASPLPPAYEARRTTRVLDCRHGRVLLRRKCSRDFVAWNPVTGHWQDLRKKPLGGNQSPIMYASYSAVVICAMTGCSGGGPFRVVCVGNNVLGNAIHASTYSSRDRAWGTPVIAHLSSLGFIRRPDFGQKRAALIGDGMYMHCSFHNRSSKVLKYDLVKGCFSIIEMPMPYAYQYKEDDSVLMQNEDGSLGLARVSGTQLEIWSAKVNPEGVEPWLQWRVVELKEKLPTDKPWTKAKVTGFAEGVGVFFISTYVTYRKEKTTVAAYTFELKSRRLSKVDGPSKPCTVFPFISFFTTDCGRSKLLSPVDTN